MQYRPELLAGHLLAVAVFASGVLLNVCMLPSLSRGGAAARGRAAELQRLLRWTLWATTPALCLVWTFGITLALLSGWFDARWLQIKLVLVVCLTALHFHQISCMRRIARGRPPQGMSYWLVLPVAAAFASIVYLATVKPI